MKTLAIALKQFNYGGTIRYQNELFEMGGGINDDALVRTNYVRIVTSDMRPGVDEGKARDDYSGREFLSDGALEAFRTVVRNQPSAVIKRRVGRPRGSTDSVQRRKPGEPTAVLNASRD